MAASLDLALPQATVAGANSRKLTVASTMQGASLDPLPKQTFPCYKMFDLGSLSQAGERAVENVGWRKHCFICAWGRGSLPPAEAVEEGKSGRTDKIGSWSGEHMGYEVEGVWTKRERIMG